MPGTGKCSCPDIEPLDILELGAIYSGTGATASQFSRVAWMWLIGARLLLLAGVYLLASGLASVILTTNPLAKEPSDEAEKAAGFLRTVQGVMLIVFAVVMHVYHDDQRRNPAA